MPDERIKILLVDDEPGNLEALEAVLEAPDRLLVRAQSGHDALRALLQDEFALILLDVFMPNMDGFEVAELVRARDQSRETPIIFLTAAAGGEFSMSRGYALGAVDYIIKPVDADILRYKVAVFVDLYRKTAEVRRQANELSEQRAFLQSVLEGATAYAIAALDEHGRFLVWNEGARRVYGRAAESMLGKHFGLLFSTDDVAAGVPAALLERVVREGRIEVEIEQVRANGRAFPARVTLDERTAEHDGYVLIARDLTDVRQAEESRQQLLREQTARREAQAAERRMQQMIDVLPEPVLIVAPTGVLTASNGAARTLFGAVPIGLNLLTGNPLGVMQPDGAPYPDDGRPLARALLNGEVVSGEEVLVQGAEGAKPTPALVNAAPVYDESGALVGGITAYQDISNLKELDRQKDEFLAAVSHDMKTPLTVIAGGAQLLERRARRSDAPEAALSADLLRSIRSTALRTASMVDALIDLARAQMHLPLQLNFEHVDLVAVTHEVVSDLQSISERHTITVRTDGSEVMGQWDRIGLERVVANLIDNAVKYSPQGGPVEVAVESRDTEAGASAVLSVRDYGVGIPARELDRVFGRFVRASNAAATPGSGIGLATVHRIVTEHAGTISLQSEEGQGTTVEIVLPKVHAAEAPSVPAEPERAISARS